jgi:eukaryotic-like serine/threonine-protein kinase
MVPASKRTLPRNLITIAVTLAVAVIASVAVAALRMQRAGEIEYRQLTYRRGGIGAARFVPSSQTIVYSAQWDRSPRQFFVVQAPGPESRLLAIRPDLSLASVSRDGELALLQFGGTMNIGGGNLLRMPLTGTAHALVARSVMSADWTPDGKAMVLVRAIDGRNQLECPSGNVIYKTAGWLSNPRHSPVSNRIAFIEHEVRHDDAGRIMLYEQGRGVRPLTEAWASAGGLAWRPRGDEIWFTAARTGSRSLWSVDTGGRIRSIAKTAGELTLRDIAADGRVLATRDVRRLEMAGLLAGDEEERDYSGLDWSRVQEVGPAGRLVLFDESGEAARPHATAYIHDAVERTTTRLGNGIAMGLHPDGRSAMLVSEDRQKLFTVPVTGGITTALPVSGLRIQWAKFFADGARLLVLGSRPNEGLRLYVCTLAAPTNLRAISEEMMIRNAAVSPDGRDIAVLKPGGDLTLYASSGGLLRTIYSAEPLAPLRWSPDGRSLYVQHLRHATDN